MNVIGCFKGDYIAAVEFNGKTPTLHIDHVQVVELEDDDGKKKSRPVVYFRETKRGWVLCKTTALCLAQMFTPETDKWTGKGVTLFAEDVQVGKEKKPGIRVKGSPDIAADMTFELKLPRKKARKVRLVKTQNGAPQQTDPLPEPEPEPEEPITDPGTGETF
ncbi:MAG: hypothetical protein RJA59_1637 [Pseudomonadota bacterium]